MKNENSTETVFVTIILPCTFPSGPYGFLGHRDLELIELQ